LQAENGSKQGQIIIHIHRWNQVIMPSDLKSSLLTAI